MPGIFAFIDNENANIWYNSFSEVSHSVDGDIPGINPECIKKNSGVI
jgi:hypothetical protein